MLALLATLGEKPREWRHGYDLMQDAGILSGTLYPLLIRMTEKGLLEAEWREPTRAGRPPRHVYRLTPTGLALARSTAEDSPEMLPRLSPT